MDNLDSLTESQKKALENFQAVTGTEDLEKVVLALRESNWNLETAVQRYFDEKHPPTSPSTTRPTGSSAADQVSSTSRSADSELSPSLFQLVLFPIRFGFRFAMSVLNYVASFLPFRIPFLSQSTPGRNSRSRRPSDPRAASARFLLDFEQQYGDVHPDFFQGTYTQALDRAKTEIRYLLAILHSPEHDDTDEFCRKTLSAEALISFLRESNFIVWAGDIRESEAYQVSNVLLATRYPFVALIALQGSRMSVIERFEGPTPAQQLIDVLRRHMNRLDPQYAAIRADRESRAQARQIREEQDEAYRASLRADQEKERKAQEAKERLRREQEEKEKEERETKAIIEAKIRRRTQLRSKLPPEPSSDEADVSTLSIRFPNGERVVRRFRASDKFQVVYDFIESRDLSPLPPHADIVIWNTYPRKQFLDREQTVKEGGLVPSGAIVVEEEG